MCSSIVYWITVQKSQLLFVWMMGFCLEVKHHVLIQFASMLFIHFLTIFSKKAYKYKHLYKISKKFSLNLANCSDNEMRWAVLLKVKIYILCNCVLLVQIFTYFRFIYYISCRDEWSQMNYLRISQRKPKILPLQTLIMRWTQSIT